MIWRYITYSLRTIGRRPAFALIAVLILALAIGGNTAVFTVVHAVLLRPLPYPESGRLVQITRGATPIRFSELKASAGSFTEVGAFASEESPTLSGAQGEPEVLKGARVSANFLRILKVDPLLGRPFRAAEDAAGGPAVVMISARLWQRRFAGDPKIVGQTATLGGTPYTIIGVLPPKFLFPFSDLDLWMTAPAEFPLIEPPSRALSPFLTIFGRLKPGVTLAAANAETKVIHGAYARAHPAMLDAKPKRPEGITPMKDTLVADVRSMLWMLSGAVSFVLLISCANLAGLLLARALSRTRELAVRAALGA